MNWQSSATPEVHARRAELLAAARHFFASRNILEVQTPVMISSSCTDPNIPSITARCDGNDMFLRTSPEHAMKRLLCAGIGDMYQIGPVFRDGEQGRYHNPEFTMIEWYRPDFDHFKMADETVALIQQLLGSKAPVVRQSYQQVFQEQAELNPLCCDLDQLQLLCQRRGIDVPLAMGSHKDDWLDLILSTIVIPAFDPANILVLYDYPPSQAALARIRHDDPAVAERFEVFFGGVELANGFHELTDASEQKQRFLSEQEQCRARGQVPPPVDNLLLQAMEQGMPDCAGVAVGFDRLLMLATGSQSLADVIAFPIDRV